MSFLLLCFVILSGLKLCIFQNNNFNKNDQWTGD
jgi:hypothetical protein